MLVIWAEALPLSERGRLTRWLTQISPNLFVGKVSAMVRDELWERLCTLKSARLVQVWPAATEAGFLVRMHGDVERQVIDLDGLQFIRIQDAAWREANERFGLDRPQGA